MKVLVKEMKNQRKIISLMPTLVGSVMGYDFYEHPIFGDEAPLLVKYDGVFYLSDFWEVPPIEEIADFI